jgi:hypothetical protein
MELQVHSLGSLGLQLYNQQQHAHIQRLEAYKVRVPGVLD